METSKLANWLQIVGNFGIVAGLLLVGVQIQQNSEIAHAQIVSDGYALISNTRLAMAGEEPGIVWAKALTHADELSDEEIIVLDAFLGAYWYSRIRSEYLAGKGFSSLTPEDYGVGIVQEVLDTPFGLAWWQESRDGFGNMAPLTRDAVQEALKKWGESHHTGEIARLGRIRDRIDRLKEG